MKRNTVIYGAIVVGIAGVLTALFLLLFERVEEAVDVPAGPAARTNGFLAAERLLNALGLPAQSVRGPVRLPPADHVIVLATPRRTLGVDRTQWLLGWVHRGGHLVVTPRVLHDPDSEDPDSEDPDSEDPDDGDSEDAAEVTTDLEDEAEKAGEADDPEEVPDPLLQALNVEVDRSADRRTDVLELRASVGGSSRKVAIARSPRIAAVGREPDFGGRSDVMARYRWGEGWVTVLSDGGFLRNAKIGEHDHAHFLWALVTTPVRPAGVWLVYRDQLPGLRRLLAARAWMLFVSAALLLATWLWSRGARFGPRLRPLPAGRRSLREHLEATAEFLWRRGQTAALVASERQAVLHEARLQHPAWSSLSEKERVQYLAEISGVAGGPLVEALEGSVGRDPDRLVRVISTLEKVRRLL